MFSTWTAKQVPNHELYRESRTIFYRNNDNPLQSLLVTTPKAAGPHPVIVWLHGGGLTGDGREYPTELFSGDRVIVEPRYRISPETPAPGAIEDAAAALAWTKHNIAGYGGDPDTIFLGGMSAGSFLATLVGCDGRYLAGYGIDNRRLAGLLLVSGQMTTHFRLKEDLGYPGESAQPVIDDYAPMAHLSKELPPMILITGESGLDMPARPEENAFMAASLRALGHPMVECYALPGHGHGGVLEGCNHLLNSFITRVLERRK